MAEQTQAEWEQAIEHELRTVDCTECGHVANWERSYQAEDDTVDVFVCRSCGHSMHINRADLVDQPEVAK